MNIGRACAIFNQINSKEYTDQEKAGAILQVIAMPTHNGITKDKMLQVIAYLWDQCFEVVDDT